MAPPAVTAGMNGVTTAFAEAVGGALLICRPPPVARTANGCAQIGWLSGPVSAEDHHWLVGRACPASSWPAWAGVRVGAMPCGSVSARLPDPAGWGWAMEVTVEASLAAPAGAAPGG